MLRNVLIVSAAVAFVGASSFTLADGCKGCSAVAKSGEGFCCGKGMAFGVQHASKMLDEALAGVKVDPAKIKCPLCKTAAAESGRCDHCNVGIAHGKVYKSNVAYRLAKGTPVAADMKIACPGCSKASKGDGFCQGCSIGFVGSRKFKSAEDHTAAVAAHETLTQAAQMAGKCELCAVAMVTDGACDHCKVSFKDGKKVSK